MHPTPVLLPGKPHGQRSLVGCSPWGRQQSDTTERLHFHALEKEMAAHSSVLAWRIPGTGEPGGLLSMWSQRVGHDWRGLAAAALVQEQRWRAEDTLSQRGSPAPLSTPETPERHPHHIPNCRVRAAGDQLSPQAVTRSPPGSQTRAARRPGLSWTRVAVRRRLRTGEAVLCPVQTAGSQLDADLGATSSPWFSAVRHCENSTPN